MNTLDLGNVAALPVNGATPAPPLAVHTWGEMVAAPVRPIEFHWPGWVSVGAVAIVAGAGESFKSWLCLYVGAMTAAGRAALSDEGGDPASIPAGPVLYIDAENAIQEQQRRCQLLRAGHGLPDDLPITFVAAESLSLSEDEGYRAVVQLVQKIRPTAIFIDSAIALSGIPQENDNVMVRTFMKTQILPLAREHGATVYLIHHSPKPPTQPGARFTDEHVARGASDWRNAADVMLYLRRDVTLGAQAVVLRHGKQRIGRRHAPIWFQLEDVAKDVAVRITYGGTYSEESGQGTAAGLSKAIAACLQILKESPGGTYKDSVEQAGNRAGNSVGTCRRAVAVLRGKQPWPYGPYDGRKHAVVTEDKHGRKVFLVFDAAQWPSDDEDDDE